MKELKAGIWYRGGSCFNQYEIDSLAEANEILGEKEPPAWIHSIIRGKEIIYQPTQEEMKERYNELWEIQKEKNLS